MIRAITPVIPFRTVAELIEQLGDIPPERIRMHPVPGTATEQDLLDADAHDGRPCELVDGVLVQKAVGFFEDRVGLVLAMILEEFSVQQDLGFVLGGTAPERLRPGTVRLPDVSYYSWSRFPNRELPPGQILGLVPDLAVEVLSPGNTKREMERKLREYFRVGVRLVWYIDPKDRTATVYTSPSRARKLTEGQALTGGKVLPGFSLPLRDLFARAERRPRSG